MLKLTAISVAAENASGTVVEMKRDGVTIIAIAVKLILFLPHQFLSPKNSVDSFYAKVLMVWNKM